MQTAEMKMYRSRLRMWLLFAAWLSLAALAALMDVALRRTIYLPTFVIASVVITLIATRKYRPRNYKFEWIGPGVVRSRFGFAVRASNSQLQYVEGDHVISWAATPMSGSIGRFNLSDDAFSSWDSPFSDEPMDSAKKLEIVRAVRAAISYLQLVDVGKIRPKRPDKRVF